MIRDQNIMGWSRHRDRVPPSQRPVTSGQNRPTRTRPARRCAPTRENGCASENCSDRIDLPASATSGRWCGGRVDSSGLLCAKKTRSAAWQAPFAVPATSTTGAGQYNRVTVNRLPDSDDNRNAGLVSGQDRRHPFLHGQPYAGNDRAARHHTGHSADIAVVGTLPDDASDGKDVDPVNRLLAEYGT